MRFRPVETADLPLLHGWLNEPGVVEWWEGDDVSWEAVQRDYAPQQANSTEQWLALDGADGAPMGWIQCFDATDSHESPHWFTAGVDRAAAGIDYLVGDPANRGRGVGSRMIAAFCEQVVFADGRSWTAACASPYAANVASWRALEKAGFTHVGTWTDDDDADCKVMVRSRSRPD